MKAESGRKRGCRRVLSVLKKQLLLILMILAMVIGVGMGWGLRYLDPPMTIRQIHYLRFPGDLLLQMLQVMIIPLVVTSIVSGLAPLDIGASGKIGNRAMAFYLNSTTLAAILGIVLVVTIEPGVNKTNKENITRSGSAEVVHIADAILDVVRISFPNNLVAACFEMTVTTQVEIKNDLANITMNDNSTNIPEKEYNPKLVTVRGLNVIGLAVFSIFLGSVISRMGMRGKILADFFEALNQAIMQLVTLVVWYSPIGVLFLIAVQMVEMTDPELVFSQLGMYCVTVVAGLLIHGLVILPLLYVLVTKKKKVPTATLR